jgi:soluble cytochrome b562
MTLLKSACLVLWLGCTVALTSPVTVAEEQMAVVTASTDVEATMKEMAFAYKKAMASTDMNEIQHYIQQLQQLVKSVQLVTFSADKQVKFQQGLTEVQAQLTLVQASLAAQNIDQAKQQLKQVDVLKKQYHKERSPSIWQLFFGN